MLKIVLYFCMIASLFATTLPKSMVIDTGFTKPGALLIERIIGEMMRRNNIELTFQILPAKRSLERVNSGYADGEAARISSINKTYPNLLSVPESVFEFDVLAVSKEKIASIKSLEDLKNFKVSALNGIEIVRRKMQVLQPKKFIPTSNLNNMLKMLNSKEVDVILINRLGIFSHFEKFVHQDFHIYKKPLIKKKLYFHLHKKHKPLVPIFLKTLQEMKKDGTFAEINRKFFNELTEKVSKVMHILQQ